MNTIEHTTQTPVQGFMSMRDITTEAERWNTAKPSRLRYRKSANVLELLRPNCMPYEVDLDRIKNFKCLLEVAHRLMDKNWISKQRIQEIITEICIIKGWSIR